MVTVKSSAVAGAVALTAMLAVGNAIAGIPGPKGGPPGVDAGPLALIVEKPGLNVLLSGIVAASDGGFWVTGTVTSDNVGTGSGYLLRVGADGTLRSEQPWAIGGERSAEFWEPVVLADGRIAVAVATPPFDEELDGGTVVFDPSGAVAGQVLLSGLGLRDTEMLSVAPLADGGLAMVGAKSAEGETGRAVIVRLNADLERRWIVTEAARDPGFDLNAYTSATFSDGGLIVGGASTDATGTSGAGWVARFGADGGIVWRRWIDVATLIGVGHTGQASVQAVAVTASGEIGSLLAANTGTDRPEEPFLARMTPDGELVALHRLDDLAPRDALSVLVATRDGDFLVGCYNGAKQMPCVARYSADGVLRWTRSLDETPGGLVSGILETEDRSIVVTGSFDGSTGDRVGFVIRLRTDGSRV